MTKLGFRCRRVRIVFSNVPGGAGDGSGPKPFISSQRMVALAEEYRSRSAQRMLLEGFLPGERFAE